MQLNYVYLYIYIHTYTVVFDYDVPPSGMKIITSYPSLHYIEMHINLQTWLKNNTYQFEVPLNQVRTNRSLLYI